MFERCTHWLSDMQDNIWEERDWGRTANYIVPDEDDVMQFDDFDVVADMEEENLEQSDFGPVDEPLLAVESGVMLENVFDQFQWP
jgi:hypothetical protein